MRTTIDIPDTLLERVRPLLAKRNMTLRAVVIDALERLLEPKRTRFTLRDASVGYQPRGDRTISADVINQAIDDMREPSR
jgi:Arc/MetJ family transcription regulator